MGSTAFVILLVLAAVGETVETNSTSVSVSVSETTSTSNLVSTSVSAPTKKTLDYKTTVIPVVDGGGNETSWRAQCNDMKSFIEGDDQCKIHQYEMPWTLAEEIAIDIAFIIGSSLSACGSGFIMSVVDQRKNIVRECIVPLSLRSLYFSHLIISDRLTFILIPRVRDFSFQIVFCLCICDFLR